MRLRWLFALATFAAAGTIAPCSAAPAEGAGASSVIVSARIGVHRDAIGAGVVVAKIPYGLRIVTARHVVHVGDVTVWIAGKPYAADIVRTFSNRDVAVLDALVPADVCGRMRVADVGETADAGDALTVWGETDEGPQMQRARVVAKHWLDPNDRARPALLAIECERCRPGDSGGGVFSANGALIGIVTARYHRTSDGAIVAVIAEPVDRSLYALEPP